MLEIDGSHGSGGGQVLRTSIGLSALLNKDVRVFNIRAGRCNPGLRQQHLQGIKAVSDFCSGDLKGAVIGSKEIEFLPGKDFKENIEVKITTAGSIGLLLQTVLLSTLKSRATIKIEGGASYGKWAPPITYFEKVLLPVLEMMGYKIELNVLKHGFYPVGGAQVEVRAHPVDELKPLNLVKQGDFKDIYGLSIASKYLAKARVAERQTEAARNMLKKYNLFAKREYVDSECPGSALMLWARSSTGCILGSDSLGERGKPAEDVGKEASKGLVSTLASGAAVDEYLSDQILPFMALAKGRSEILAPKLTRHAETNIWVIRKFLDTEFSMKGEKGLVRIACMGKGL